ncbi:uncharacterized protein LOC130699908 [Daphnia carinata]|uniref:uncharacterized protein LOC130699908 n=1 Tax=Daphnia carinata TaxID=120202 RepID=UPI00257A1107|nr:uncharacterized protein LOC130699908 [Daphnia carinata]
MRVQGKDEDVTEYYHDVLDMCRIVQPDMAEEVRIDHLFRGLSPTLYERLYVLGIKTCEDFLEEARLHADAVKTAYERGYEDRRREREKPAVGAVDLDQMQDLRRQIQELRDELARAKDPSKKKEKEGGKSDWNKKPKKKNPFRCFNCDEEGHIARNCQKEKKKETAVKPKKPEGEEPKAACAVIGGDQSSEVTNGDRQPTEEIWIGGRPVDALVDTGAVISVISPSLASRFKLKIVPWEGPMVVTADGQPMNPRGEGLPHGHE